MDSESRALQDSGSDYPPLDAPDVADAPTYPYFGIRLANRLIEQDEDEIMYGYPHPSSQTPETGMSHLLDSLDERDDHDDEIEGVPHQSLAALDGNQPEVDGDFDPDREMSDSDPESDASSEDPRLIAALRDIEETQQQRGNGRGRGRPRTRADGSGRGRRGGRGALIAALIRRVDGEEAPAARGRRRRKGEGERGGGKGRRGPRPIADPGPEFKSCQFQATKAYENHNLEKAEELALHAIQINPEIFAAHSLLSQIYLEQGKNEESLAVLWSGAHTKREKSVWLEVAHRTKVLLDENDSRTLDQQLYCYSQIIKLDHKDMEGRKGKLEVYSKQGLLGKCIRECAGILKIDPYDLGTLQQFAGFCISLKDAGRAKQAYEVAIQHYQQIESDDMQSKFSMSDLNIYLELFMHLRKYEEGLAALKSISRWLLGRKEETCWDGWDINDCELDVDDDRRISVPGFEPGKYDIETYGELLPAELRAKLGIFRLKLGPDHLEEAMQHFEFFNPEKVSADTLDHFLDVFCDIARALHDCGQHEQATDFYKVIIETDSYLTIDVWLGAAASSKFIGQLDNAVKFYKKAAIQEPGNVRHKLEILELFDRLGYVSQAEAQAAEIVAIGDRNTIKEARLRASRHVKWGPPTKPLPVEKPPPSYHKIFEEDSPDEEENDLGDNAEAESEDGIDNELEAVTEADAETDMEAEEEADFEVMQGTPNKRKTKIASRPAATRTPKPKKPSRFVNDNPPEIFRHSYEKACKLKNSVRDGDTAAINEWMKVVRPLIEDFSKEPLFYEKGYYRFRGYTSEARKLSRMSVPDWKDRQAAQAVTTGFDAGIEIDEDVPDEYRGILFTDWVDLFCEYAYLAAQRRDLNETYRVLAFAENANVFSQDPQFELHVSITACTCALLLSDEEKLISTARELTRKHIASTNGFRLYAALARLFHGTPSWYNSGPSQKYLMRQVKAMDYSLLDETNRKGFAFTPQEVNSYAPYAESAKESGGIYEHDPILLTLYGHILATAGSYHNALNYYYRAYAIAPNDSCLNLSMALAYGQFSLKRQSENRHYAITQGLAFIKRYADARMSLIDYGSQIEGEEQRKQTSEREAAIMMQEIVFNEARYWHMLGLAHLAIEGYERCLEMNIPERVDSNAQMNGGANGSTNNEVNADRGEDLTLDGQSLQADGSHPSMDQVEDTDAISEPDFYREAAYALQQIYALGGDTKKAREIGEKWLVF